MLLSGPIIAHQGEIKNGTIRVPAGPAFRLISLSLGPNFRAELDDVSCLSEGDCIHVRGLDGCCTLHFSTYRILAVDEGSSTVNLELASGYEPRTLVTNGQVVKAMDLRGFSLVGSVATRNPNVQSLPGLVGSIAKGSNQVLVTAPLSAVSLGDSFTFSCAGIHKARVTGIYRASGSATSPAASLSSSCGCSGPEDEESSKVAPASTAPEQLVLTLSEKARSSVAASHPEPIEIRGESLADFEFTYDDAECGVIPYQLDLRKLAAFELPSGDCDGPPCRIGCYQIALIRGRLPTRATYPPGNYYDWLRVIGSGEVALRPTLLNLFLETIEDV